MPAAEAEGASEEATTEKEATVSYLSVVIEFNGGLALEAAQVSLARRLAHAHELNQLAAEKNCNASAHSRALLCSLRPVRCVAEAGRLARRSAVGRSAVAAAAPVAAAAASVRRSSAAGDGAATRGWAANRNARLGWTARR